MENVYDLLTQAADILDRAQNNLNGISTSELNTRLYDLRCGLEDLREDVQENV
jgi:hypothetical protein